MTILRRLLHFSNIIFYPLLGITYLASWIESIAYRGIFLKYFKIDFNILMWTTFFVGVLAVSSDTPAFYRRWARLYKFFFSIATPLVIFLYLLLTIINSLNYDNYIFTHLHIIPPNLRHTATISIFAFFFYKFNRPYAKKNKETSSSKVILFIVFLFYAMVLFENTGTPVLMAHEYSAILKNPMATYEQKMGYKWDKDFYTLVSFVKKNTPESSVILIPPRADPWGLEGNDHLMRGFLYPRRVISYDKLKNTSIRDFDYVLVSWGYWRKLTNYSVPKGFPDFDVKGEKITLVDLATGKTATLPVTIYEHKNIKYHEAYGLIRL